LIFTKYNYVVQRGIESWIRSVLFICTRYSMIHPISDTHRTHSLCVFKYLIVVPSRLLLIFKQIFSCLQSTSKTNRNQCVCQQSRM